MRGHCAIGTVAFSRASVMQVDHYDTRLVEIAHCTTTLVNGLSLTVTTLVAIRSGRCALGDKAYRRYCTCTRVVTGSVAQTSPSSITRCARWISNALSDPRAGRS
jgi:hypothetical protein